MPKLLIVLGLTLVLVGALWPWLSKLGLGRLPGDIIWERGNTRVYFPIVTSLVLSVVLSVVFYLFSRWRG